MQIDDFVKEIIRKYKELREKLSQVDPFTGCKIFLQQFFPGRYFRTFTIAVKLILSLGFLVSALFLSSTYLTFRVRLETDQPGQTEVRMSDKTDFRKSLHVREMVSVGESIVSFPVRKKKHYLYYPLLRKDATLNLKEMQVSAGIFRAVFSARDLSGLKKQNCRISEDGTLVAATADPIIFLDWKQIRERFQLHFSSSVVLFLIFCAATVALIWWFNLDRCGRIVERYPWLLSRPFGYCLWGVLFILLTLAGITGSPLGLHRNFNISSLHNERLLFGKYQMIRSDDYIAHGSGSAIINYKHSPAFPVKNTNIRYFRKKYAFPS